MVPDGPQAEADEADAGDELQRHHGEVALGGEAEGGGGQHQRAGGGEEHHERRAFAAGGEEHRGELGLVAQFREEDGREDGQKLGHWSDLSGAGFFETPRRSVRAGSFARRNAAGLAKSKGSRRTMAGSRLSAAVPPSLLMRRPVPFRAEGRGGYSPTNRAPDRGSLARMQGRHGPAVLAPAAGAAAADLSPLNFQEKSRFILASAGQCPHNAPLCILLGQSAGCVGGPMSQARALFQLGIDLDENPSASKTEEQDNAALASSEERKDFFIERDGERFAGTHLIVDLWGADRIDDLAYVEDTLRECVAAAEATLLHIHLHHFTPNDGISGVAVLAESHISIHSWPETGYAALDIFMCGDAKPHRAVEVLRRRFNPSQVVVEEVRRGSGL